MRDDDAVETPGVPAASSMADLSGSILSGRYRLGAPLGQGSVANVYRAVDDRLGRKVAVKLFHPGQDVATRARFAAEAQALARLSHPGLISIFDAGVEDDRPYLVMQLVDGESLRDRLLDGPLTTGEVVQLGIRLSLALAHVHQNGIVHRDIKPSNIVLDATGAPHLADFGIALLLDAARMTGSNEIMGTAAYLSPEQILGVEVGSPADIYSLGLVLLECLTGELEYPGGSKVESALARLSRPPRIPDGVPPVLAKLLTAMTSRDAEDRPAAKDCAAWFVAVREHRGISSRRARMVAANWLVGKGQQFGRARERAPLFSGWRRFAIAGSGLAMAIFASAWLFTSLLPKVMPMGPDAGGDTQQHSSTGGPAGGVVLQPNGTAMHVAAAMTGTGARGEVPMATTAVPTTGTSVPGQVSITPTFPGTPDDTPITPPSNELQDSSSAVYAGSVSTSPPPDPPSSSGAFGSETSSPSSEPPSNGPASSETPSSESPSASSPQLPEANGKHMGQV
ncbi:MAG TPA: serine/threonine-protein kinase, partial [Pseudonocardiaceae bacterium]|nr:serine/threonine-protein kinase [Pseudonocardiaceae bacterium]